MTSDILRLPAYPTTRVCKALAPSQLAGLNQTIASALSIVLALPPEKSDNPSSRQFVSSYARENAQKALQKLIFEEKEEPPTTAEKNVQKGTLLLAENIAPSLEIQTLLELSIALGRSQIPIIRDIFRKAAQSNPLLQQEISNDLIPGFAAILSQQTPSSQGLYAQRKIAETVFAFLHGAKGTSEFMRPFTQSKDFVLALAQMYDSGMTSIASAYGGLTALAAGISEQDREADDWERIWVATKVALFDAFHILFTTLLVNLASAPRGAALAAEAELTFDIIFSILEIPPSPSSQSDIPPTPFLNRTLLQDYQHAFDLSKFLAMALKHAEEKDPRLDILESTLLTIDEPLERDPTTGYRYPKPGALKILLRSSGIQPGIDIIGNRVNVTPTPIPKPKGKSRAITPPPPPSDPDLDLKTTQVLDILPDTPIEYIKFLLAHDRYGRDPERVVAALLDGTAMPLDELQQDWASRHGQDVGLEDPAEGGQYQGGAGFKEDAYTVDQRKNIYDDDKMDVSKLRIGKKTTTGDDVLRDRTFIEQMKADILRRAELAEDEEEEYLEIDDYIDSASEAEMPKPTSITTDAKGKGKAIPKPSLPTRAVEEEDDSDFGLEIPVNLRIAGDDEDSEEDEEDEEEKEEAPETIIEQAYFRDPSVFERDATTRKSKARAELKTLTGWGDEQIEGWKIMLDRNPGAKDKLKEKYAFRGNEKGLLVQSGSGKGGRGRGRGRGRGGGGGGGGRGGGGSGGDASARDRAWKDKNKASRGNHNRKRGHDKKMARAGPGPSR